MKRRYFTNLDIVQDEETEDIYLYVSGNYYQLNNLGESRGALRKSRTMKKIGTLSGVGFKIKEELKIEKSDSDDDIPF